MFAMNQFVAVLMSCVRPGGEQRHAWPAHVWQSCWKELETLSNQERSSGCYPFNYVVWVSTVITGEAGRGRAGGGLCVCVCICGYSVWLSGPLMRVCVCKLWGLMLFMLWMCVCRSEHLQMCSLFQRVCSLFAILPCLPLVSLIHSFSKSEPCEIRLCFQPQRAKISEWLYTLYFFKKNYFQLIFLLFFCAFPFFFLSYCLSPFVLFVADFSLFFLQMANSTRPPLQTSSQSMPSSIVA